MTDAEFLRVVADVLRRKRDPRHSDDSDRLEAIANELEAKSAIADDRKQALVELVAAELNSREWFAYHDWDMRIEVDGALTEDELNWLRDHAAVTVSVSAKEGA